MVTKTNRLIVLITACSAVGAVLGGVSNWVESNQCLQARHLTNQCLTQDPVSATIQGMSIGLIAGAGAAFGATRQLKQESE